MYGTSYLFYDLETTGLNPCFDQILQFAAIRADLELREIEQYNIRVKLRPDVVPAPKAIILQNISMEQLSEGVSEYEAIKKIYELVNQPGTVSIGYNSLSFDNEFLRFAFHRNLMPPYKHQYANGCSRMDLYPIIVMFYLFKRKTLKWAETDGKPSFKLEVLSRQNNLMKGSAHDALVDATATLELARLLHKETAMWDYLRSYFDKSIDEDRIIKLSEALIFDGSYGFDNYFQIPALQLGKHNHYVNQVLWLRLDLPELIQTSPENIVKTTYVIRKRAGDLGLLLPIIPRFMGYLSAQRQQIMTANRDWINANKGLLAEIVSFHKEYKYPEVPNVDIDAALYQLDFLTDYDQKLCRQFHAADLAGKIDLITKFNQRLRTQAIRLICRNYADNAPPEYRLEFDEYLANIDQGLVVDYKNRHKYFAPEALSDIAKISQENLTEDKQKLWHEFKAYLIKKC